MNIFEYATRNKLRFEFKGLISVEDLWDLSLTQLDSIFKKLNKEAKVLEEESLLVKKTKVDEEVETKIEIVKHIVSVKLEEQKARQEAAVKKEKKERLMSIIATKKDEALQNASIEDLEKMLSELE